MVLVLMGDKNRGQLVGVHPGGLHPGGDAAGRDTRVQ